MAEDAEQVQAIAKEIEHYLRHHPEAADSAEGIATWWLTRQRIHYELSMVKAALTWMQQRGLISTSKRAESAEAVYRLSRKD